MTCRCEEESQSDYVSVTSDYVTEDHATSGRRMCGRNAQYTDVEQFRSDSSSLYVEFRSNDVFDGTGFEATYQFYSPVQGTTITDKILNVGCLSFQTILGPVCRLFGIFLQKSSE